ncbi:MAG: alginate export family protein [Aquirhabdus sp.]
MMTLNTPKPPRKTLLSASIMLAAIGFSATASADDDLSNLWEKGKFTVDGRVRFEGVDVDKQIPSDTIRNAKAWTARIRPGFQTGVWNGFSGVVEGEATAELDDSFNSTRNGKTTFASVPDPKNIELNQLYLKYAYSPKFDMTVGRQRINLDNQRYVGGAAWRQNEQTFDAVSLNLKPIKEFGLYYAYIDHVNTFFGSEDIKPAYNNAQLGRVDSNSHLLQLKYAPSPLFNAVAYGYLLDLDKYAVSPTALPGTNSNKTFGLRVTGADAPFKYALEYARQSDYGTNPLQYSADYYLIEGTMAIPQFKAVPDLDVTAGYEVMGNDSSVTSSKVGAPKRFAFQTPLGTKHKFDGYADLFLATPAYGLVDTYVSTSGKIPTYIGNNKVKFEMTYHWFTSAEGSSQYGEEFDLVLSSPIGLPKAVPMKGALSVTTKLSHYMASANAPKDAFPITKNAGNRDTDKVWLQLDYKY